MELRQDGEFLRRQAGLITEYGFDTFIVDAGWYEHVGAWRPDLEKFAEGGFEEILSSVKQQGVTPGIWTCPQFVGKSVNEGGLRVDKPGFYEDFIDGHLVQLTDPAFQKWLPEHVTELRERYSAGWWKYDQLLFTESTRDGVMKNVAAFQDALTAVRRAHPDLAIENCQSGGRMVNEFTVLLAQAQWLRDGGHNGIEHARSNISEALGAMQFIFPWAVLRWTNNPDRMDTDDDELTRYYCRSAMAGTWGIVADLARIPEDQRRIIAEEINNYRRLNEFKRDCMYDLLMPGRAGDTAGAVFYKTPDTTDTAAAVLLYRWDAEGAYTCNVPLGCLKKDNSYRIEDIDAGTVVKRKGASLCEKGLPVEFAKDRLSALLFVEPAD